jgi:hypothetical protein
MEEGDGNEARGHRHRYHHVEASRFWVILDVLLESARDMHNLAVIVIAMPPKFKIGDTVNFRPGERSARAIGGTFQITDLSFSVALPRLNARNALCRRIGRAGRIFRLGRQPQLRHQARNRLSLAEMHPSESIEPV